MSQSNANRNPAVSIYLSPKNHRRLKLAAIDTGRAMTDICREQVEKWLDAHETGEVSEPALPEVKAKKLREAQRLIDEALDEA